MCPTNSGAKVHKISHICKSRREFLRKKAARGAHPLNSRTTGGKQAQKKRRLTLNVNRLL